MVRLGRTHGWAPTTGGAHDLLAAWLSAFGHPQLRSQARGIAERWLPGQTGRAVSDPGASLATWDPASDPLRLDRASWVQALQGPLPGSVLSLRGWVRAAFEVGRNAADVATAVDDRWMDVGKRWAHPAWRAGSTAMLPAVTYPTLPDLEPKAWAEASWQKGRVLAVVGPAAAGKTTLARKLALEFGATFVSADDSNWPGPGNRYDFVDGIRRSWVNGPGLVNDGALAQAIDAAPGRVVVEGCFVGLDPRIADRVTSTLLVIRDDVDRLTAAFLRDKHRGFDVVTDICAKAFHEDIDGIAPLATRAAGRFRARVKNLPRR